MTYAPRIIDTLGGVRETARLLGMSASAVQGWKARGTIPDEHKPRVLGVAQARGLPLTRDDFWPAPHEAPA